MGFLNYFLKEDHNLIFGIFILAFFGVAHSESLKLTARCIISSAIADLVPSRP